jgi:hypothetical protein
MLRPLDVIGTGIATVVSGTDCDYVFYNHTVNSNVFTERSLTEKCN